MVQKKKYYYNQLTKEKQEMLMSLPNFKWNGEKEEHWQDKFQQLTEFVASQNKLPEFSGDVLEETLARWIFKQKKNVGNQEYMTDSRKT